MEMLKKLMIVLAIAGSCAVQAAAGGVLLLQPQFETKDFYETEGVIRGKVDDYQIIENWPMYRIKGREYCREQKEIGMRHKVIVYKCCAISSFARRLENCIKIDGKDTFAQNSFAHGVIVEGNAINLKISKLLQSDAFNESLQNNYDLRMQVKTLADTALLLSEEINNLLMTGKKWWDHHRTQENISAIEGKLKELNVVYEAIQGKSL